MRFTLGLIQKHSALNWRDTDSIWHRFIALAILWLPEGGAAYINHPHHSQGSTGFCSPTSLESATARPAARCAFRQVAGARIQWDSCRVTSCFLGLKILILKLCRGNPMVMDAHFIVSEAKDDGLVVKKPCFDQTWADFDRLCSPCSWTFHGIHRYCSYSFDLDLYLYMDRNGFLDYFQWDFQDPKMEVLYHIRQFLVGIFPCIGLL